MVWTWTRALPITFKEYTTSARDALGDPPDNVTIYNTTLGVIQIFNGFTGVWQDIISVVGNPGSALLYLKWNNTENYWEPVNLVSSTTTKGVLELIDSGEAVAGTDTSRAVTTRFMSILAQDNRYMFAVDAGSTDAYVVSLVPPTTTLVAGQVVWFDANTANTDGATLNVNGLGAKDILKHRDQALATGDIEAGQHVGVIYNGTAYEMFTQLAQNIPDAHTVASHSDTTATGAETETLTDGSDASSLHLHKRVFGVLVSGSTGDALTTGNSKAIFRVPSEINTWSLTKMEGCVTTKSSSGAVTVMAHKSSRTNATTRTADTDMLATILTIDVNEFDTIDAAAAVAETDGSEDVVTGDHIHIDVDGAGTAVKGLFVELTFQKS